MKKSTLKQIFMLAAFFALAGSFASCNKGYGCPTNFKAGKIVQTAVEIIK